MKVNFEAGRIIVTGGAGFIGSNLVKRLIGLGAEVRVIDNLWRGRRKNLIREDGSQVLSKEEDFVLADLTDYQACLACLRDADLVYHLADVVGGVHFAFHKEAFIFRQNMLINSNVLGACVENGVPNYVYVGTACSYPKSLQMSDGVVAFREDQAYPAEPESSYGWSKLMGEYEAGLAKKNAGMNVGLLRFHNVYGPGVSYDPQFSQVLPSLILKAIRHPADPFIVWGSGTQYRDFVYIDDIVQALLLVAGKGMNQGVIQIGSECATTIREAAERIVEISGKDIDIVFDATKPEGDRGRIAVCDRARDVLDWRCIVSFRNGIERTYRWIERELLRG